MSPFRSLLGNLASAFTGADPDEGHWPRQHSFDHVVRMKLYDGSNMDAMIDSIRTMYPELNVPGMQMSGRVFDAPFQPGHRWNMVVHYHKGDRNMTFWSYEKGWSRQWSAGIDDLINPGWFHMKLQSDGWVGLRNEKLSAAIEWMLGGER